VQDRRRRDHVQVLGELVGQGVQHLLMRIW
jgi:hypothetical protein